MSEVQQRTEQHGVDDEALDPSIESNPVWKWLNPRFGIEKMGLKRFILEAMNAPHPRRMNPLDYLGDVLLFLFVNQILTGLLLMTHYNGSAMAAGTADNPFPAYASTLSMTHIWWQAFVRDMHFWGANLMIVAVSLHMGRVFYLGAYKPPREFQWLSGLVLLACTLGLGITGYLLPWDQQAYWATQVATAMVKYVPWVGPDLLTFVRGCRFTCGSTLTLFFTVHVVLLPLILLLTVGLHVLLVIIHGQVDVEAKLPETYRRAHRIGDSKDFPKGYVPFFPNTVLNIVLYSLGTAILLAILAGNIPAPLTTQANYVNVPPAVPAYYKPLPLWYFLQFYQVLKVAKTGIEDRILILGVPLIIGGILVLLPFLDKNPSHRPQDRPMALFLGALFVVGVNYYEYAGYQAEFAPQISIKAPIANPSFHKDILPLLKQQCVTCHINATSGGLSLKTYDSLMAGGSLGPVVMPGDPDHSHLVLLIKGQDPALPGLTMPLGGTPLSDAEIQTIANWVNNGAKNN